MEQFRLRIDSIKSNHFKKLSKQIQYYVLTFLINIDVNNVSDEMRLISRKFTYYQKLRF